MKKIFVGQVLLILCCAFYLIWWYRGYRPGVSADRVGGLNGVLLLITAALGITGMLCSLGSIEMKTALRLDPHRIVVMGLITYILLLLITRLGFHRIVTTELFLIVGWTTLELTVVNRLLAAGCLTDAGFRAMCAVIAAAFTISIVFYVAYYRMDEMKAFYAAMVPLVTEGVSMAVLIGLAAA